MGNTVQTKVRFGKREPCKNYESISGSGTWHRYGAPALYAGAGFNSSWNIILGSESVKNAVLDTKSARQKIEDIMQKNAMPVDLDVYVEDLPVGLQQRVEILKLLYRGAETLVLDEPTAVLTPQETTELFKTLKALKEQGRA